MTPSFRSDGSAPGSHLSQEWLATISFCALAALFWMAARVPGARLELFERGHWLGPASDMLAGKVPYRDTFPIHGFLSDGGLDYLAFRLVGPEFAISVNARQLVGILFPPAVFLVAAAASRNVVLALATVPLSLGMSTAIVADRPVVPLLSLAAFVWAIGDRGWKFRAFLAGLLGGIGLLYALEFGIYVIAAEMLTIAACWRLSKRELLAIASGAFLLGVTIVLIPWLVFLSVVGGLGQFLKVSFWDLPIRFHSIWPIDFPGPWTFVRELALGRDDFLASAGVAPAVMRRLYLAPAIGVLGLAAALWTWPGSRSPLALRLLAVSLACLGFFRSVLARFHVEAGNALVGPVILLVLLLTFEFSARRRSPAILLALIAVGSTLAVSGPQRFVAVLGNAAHFRQRSAELPWTVPLTVPRGGGIRVPRDEARISVPWSISPTVTRRGEIRSSTFPTGHRSISFPSESTRPASTRCRRWAPSRKRSWRRFRLALRLSSS